MPTRTINDFSTVAEASRTHSSTSAASSAPPTTPSDRPIPLQENSDSTIKPTHLDLPKPQRFSIPESDHPEFSSARMYMPRSSFSDEPDQNAQLQAASVVSSTAVPGSSALYGQGMRVLVVDDDPLTRRLMTRMLTRLGCKVTTAENGEIALDLILNPGASRPTPTSEDTGSTSGILDGATSSSAGGGSDDPRYAIVFLDNQMPVMSGLEAVSQLRSRGRQDFVVGVTGNALLSDQEEYLDAGVDQYVFLTGSLSIPRLIVLLAGM